MIKYLLVIIMLLISTLTFAAVTNQSNPYTMVNEVVKNTFNRLKKEQLKINSNPDYLRKLVEEELLPYIQVKYAGALVLGRYYKDATPVQRELYFNAFRE